MARETLKDFLSTIVAAEEVEGEETGAAAALDRIAITVDQVGGVAQSPQGLGIEPGTGRALLGPGNPNDPSSLLTEYFSYIIENATNIQKFTPNSSQAQSANRGDFLPNADNFVDPLSPLVHSPFGSPTDLELDKFSNSFYFHGPATGTEDAQTLSDLIVKTSGENPDPTDPAKRSAHDLLKGVTSGYAGDTPEDFIVEAATSALRRNNRFNDADNNGFTEDAFNVPRSEGAENISIQATSGEYTKDEFLTSVKKLSNVAAALMLRSTGYNAVNVPLVDDGAGALIAANEGQIEDGVGTQRVQLGSDPAFLKRSVLGLQARNAHGAPNAGLGPRLSVGRSIPIVSGSMNAETFGSTYNYAVNFTGKGLKAHRVKTAMSIIATYTLVKNLFINIAASLAEDDSDEFNDLIGDVLAYASKGYAGTLPLGTSRRMESIVATSWFRLNILTPLRVDYSQALQTGLTAMFGASPFADLTQASLDAAVDAAGISGKHRYSDSLGYWSAVCDSVMRETAAFNRRIAEMDVTNFESTYETTVAMVRFFNEDNRVLKFMNVMAMIGEKVILNANNIVDTTDPQGKPLGPNRIRNLPHARPGKSRVGRNRARDQQTEDGKPEGVLGDAQISWSSTSVPSMYLLPVNVMRAVGRLNNSFSGPNPGAAMLGSQMVRNTYTSLDVDGTGNRIPNRVVKIVEDRLDAEYVPFYFHDLRTNEIISFHAFLTELGDTITPGYNSINGYGRMDPVQQYVSTSRSLRVGFTVYATNREDFDEMWYKINKLVTLLYPQWSQGTFVHAGETGHAIDFFGIKLGAKGADFYQPFSQVIGASPLIRLRVGDVIKSNYSRFNLARLFGIGDAEVRAKPLKGTLHANAISLGQEAFGLQEIMNGVRDAFLMVLMAIYGSAHGMVELGSRLVPALPGSAAKIIGNAAADAISSFLAKSRINGFTNIVANDNILDIIRDPASFSSSGYKSGERVNGTTYNALPNMVDGYFCIDTGQQIFTPRRLRVKFKGTDDINTNASGRGETVYQVTIQDSTAGDLDGKKILIRHRDLLANPMRLFEATTLGGWMSGGQLDVIAGMQETMIDGMFEGADQAGGNEMANILAGAVAMVIENPEAYFMRPEANPFVKAYQSTKGRGLAGVIKGINFNWLDENIPWETDFNSRAPIGCDISFDFDVIHDIAPGLGHDGYNRAPLYNVGSIMRNISGDPYKEINSTSEIFFRKGGSTVPGTVSTIRSTGTTSGGGSA
mgnify:CR=1 FL=1